MSAGRGLDTARLRVVSFLPDAGSGDGSRAGKRRVKTYLLSWLRKAHGGRRLDEFERDMPGPWLVWEAGPWRPPSARRDTLVSGPETRLLSSGESLAILLAPRKGGAAVALGRHVSNDLVVDDATLSRVHLFFAVDGQGRWSVRDGGSRNGTKVDGAPIGEAPVAIVPGAVIEAGAVRLTFYDAAGLFLRVRAGN